MQDVIIEIHGTGKKINICSERDLVTHLCHVKISFFMRLLGVVCGEVGKNMLNEHRQVTITSSKGNKKFKFDLRHRALLFFKCFIYLLCNLQEGRKYYI